MVFLNFMRVRKRNRGTDMGMDNIKKERKKISWVKLRGFIVHCAHVQFLSHFQIFVTPWTVARQAPLSMGFSRQEHWSGLLCPPPRGLPDPGVKPMSVTSPASAGRFFTTGSVIPGSISQFLQRFESHYLVI